MVAMHRLATIPGAPDPAEGPLPFVEQQPAAMVLLSSADTDLAAVATLLEREPGLIGASLRALNLAALGHPAVIDHYVTTTLAEASVVLVRLLGGRGHWSYGLERLQAWSRSGPERTLLVLGGTAEEERSLAELGNADPEISLALAVCLREGGATNLRQVLRTLEQLRLQQAPMPPAVKPAPDPLPHDWRDDAGPRVGVILYRAQRQAGDTDLMEAALAALRLRGLAPRGLWVSSLREAAVQEGVAHLFRRERVEAVLCGTGFASVRFEEAGLGAPLWERLEVPVFQMLCSARGRAAWEGSSIGLGPLDLSLQVVLPELDGRVTTRVAAFKEWTASDPNLGTALHRSEPDRQRLAWIAELVERWILLARTPEARRRVALVLANYPTRNSRLANGVGLDTPASAVLMLRWLAEAGYGLRHPLPADGNALIQRLLAGRTNDPESGHRPPLSHLPLPTYLRWYGSLPLQGRERLEAVWGAPDRDESLEPMADGAPGFPIRGLDFGAVCLLVQPDRGYDRAPERTYHSPDLPPTHAYLAQYLWLRESFGCQAVVHVGKHGNLEWLPGKAVGLAETCFPEWALGPMPHLYPFIVNDPGEGSQAKRRSQAVILDHLTPPLGRAGLHGDLQALEALLDEYWETRQLGADRAETLRIELERRLAALNLPEPPGGGVPGGTERLEAADGYLCELKEAQIRLGLHTYGTLPEPQKLAELLLCLARPPQGGLPGLTQALARDLDLALDPWADREEAPLEEADRRRLQQLFARPAPADPMPTQERPDHPSGSECSDPLGGGPGVVAGEGTTALRHCGDAIALLEQQALRLLQREVDAALPVSEGSGAQGAEQAGPGPTTCSVLRAIRQRLLPDLLACGDAERQALLSALAGRRIAAGPSGAPSRGRPDVLPTGRNFYSVDLRGLPTETAWDLGRRSAELLLEEHLQSEGDDLRHLALTVWGTATMRNGGEDIGQALALMGVRPVWDGPTRRLVDLEVLPLTLLGRPRVDVTLRISGLFRDAFPQLVGWFNRACSLVASLDEADADNPLLASARREGQAWRVYGSAPGAYGAGLQALIDSGHWESRSDLGEAFLQWSAWRYGPALGTGAQADDGPAAWAGDPSQAGIEATPDRSGLEARLRQVQVVLHNQDNREHDLLDSDDYYQFQGGLSAAVEQLRGTPPQLWFADHSRSERPRVHRLEKEFDKVLRSRLLNPRWIEAMQGHGYKGGFEMAASLDYLFAYDASTGRVPDWSYGALTERWLQDPAVLTFLRRCNPWALRDMAERMLEAHHRGLWESASAEQLTGLRELVLATEALVEGP
jgi:cobaltochelatase CobN